MSEKITQNEYFQARDYLLRKFVGREQEISLVKDCLDKIRDGELDLKILHVEGTEGIGKTWFLLRVKYELEDKVPVVYVDLSNYYPQGGGLRLLLRDIARGLKLYGLETICFDIMNAIYVRVRQGLIESREEGLVGDLSDIAKNIPRLRKFVLNPEAIKYYGERLQELIDKKFGDKIGWFIGILGRSYGEAMFRLLVDDPECYVYLMAESLRIDIINNVRNDKADVIVLLLDNYHALQDLVRRQRVGPNRGMTEEDTVILLLVRLKQSLVIIASEDRIRWAERFPPIAYYAKEGKVIERVVLSKFSQDQMKIYLNKAGITDQTIENIIINLADGKPILLSCLAEAFRQSDLHIGIEQLQHGSTDNVIKACIDALLSRAEDTYRRTLLVGAILALDDEIISKTLGVSSGENTILEGVRSTLERFGFLELPIGVSRRGSIIHKCVRRAILNSFDKGVVDSLKAEISKILWERYKSEGKIDYCISAINLTAEFDERLAFEQYLEAWRRYHHERQYESLKRLYYETSFSSIENILDKNIYYAITLSEEGRYNLAEWILTDTIKVTQSLPREKLDNIGYAYHLLGRIQRHLRRYDEAEMNFRKAIDLYREALKSSTKPDPNVYHRYASALRDIGSLYRLMGKLNEATMILSEAVDSYKSVIELYGCDERTFHGLSRILIELGVVYLMQQRYPESENAIKDAIKVLREASGVANKRDPKLLINLANALCFLGVLYSKTKRFNEAKEVLSEALKTYENALQLTKLKSATIWSGMGLVQSRLAYVHRSLYEYEAEISALKSAIKLYKKALGVQRWNAKIWSRLGYVQSVMGAILRIHGRYDLAEKILNRAIISYKEAINIQGSDTRTLEALALVQSELGEVYRAQRKYDEAERVLKESISLLEEILNRDPNAIEALQRLGYTKSLLGSTYIDQRQYIDAKKQLEEAIEAYRKILQRREARDMTVLNNLGFAYLMLGSVYRGLGMYHEAVHVLRNSIDIYREALNYADWKDAEILSNLGNAQVELALLYRELGDIENAKDLLTEAISSYEKALELLKYGHIIALNNLGVALNCLGEIHKKQGNYLEAEQNLNAAIEMLRKAIELAKGGSIVAWNNLGNALSSLGDIRLEHAEVEEAIKIYKEALRAFKRAYSRSGSKYFYPLLKMAQIRIKLCDALCKLGKCDLDEFMLALDSITDFHLRFKNPEYTSFLLYSLFETARRDKLPERHIRFLMTRVIKLRLPLEHL